MNLFHQQPESAAELPDLPVISRGVIALVLLISLAGIANHDLWTPDEPREAALALNMSRTGDWIVPRLAGEPFVEKPPLFYIAAAFFLSHFGPALGNTTALRLSAALWGLGTLGMTYLIGRRLWGPPAGRLALLILAVMPGFVHVTHWILVDNALMFFVAAACWCLTEAYLAQRFGFLALAGVCAGGAFLAKGLIGPIMIALGGAGLLAAWIKQHGWSRLLSFRNLVRHALALVFLAGLAGAWMLALRRAGGPELWQAWFWDNHVGRFLAPAPQLGHKAWAGYYLAAIPLCLLPWLVAWLIALGGAGRKLWRRESLGRAGPFLLGWGLGGLILLSCAATKREIYLSVLLPALALMTVPALREPLSAWVRGSLKIWLGLMLAALGLLIVAPVCGGKLGMPGREQLLYSGVALLLAAGAGWAGLRRGRPWLERWWLVTIVGYVSLLSVLVPLVDRVKSYGPAFQELAGLVASAPDQPAAWAFDETTRAGFYYYSDLVFPPVSNSIELQAILGGTHPRYQGVLTLARRFPPAGIELPAWRVAAEARMGPARRLQWITGNPAGK